MENIQFTVTAGHGNNEVWNILRLKHYLYFTIEKSIIERVMQYISG